MFRSLRISHVEFWFPGSEKLGPSRNGRMERNFPVIPILRNFRPTSRGTTQISEWNYGKCLFHSLPNPEFPEFLVKWKAARVARLPGAPCLLARGTRLGGVAFCHVNGSSRAISANRGEINRQNMASRSKYFRSYHLPVLSAEHWITVNLKRSM